MGRATKKQTSSKNENQKVEILEKKARLAKVAILKQKLQCQQSAKKVYKRLLSLVNYFNFFNLIFLILGTNRRGRG